MCTRTDSWLSLFVQGLGYQGEIGYQTFLYSSMKEWRKLLMFLLEKLPRDTAQAADEPMGEGGEGEGEKGKSEGRREGRKGKSEVGRRERKRRKEEEEGEESEGREEEGGKR